MGSFYSSHQPVEVVVDNNFAASKVRRSKRMLQKLRSRQSSRSDLEGHQQQPMTSDFDPNKFQGAHNPDGGETANRDPDSATADVGE